MYIYIIVCIYVYMYNKDSVSWLHIVYRYNVTYNHNIMLVPNAGHDLET